MPLSSISLVQSVISFLSSVIWIYTLLGIVGTTIIKLSEDHDIQKNEKKRKFTNLKQLNGNRKFSESDSIKNNNSKRFKHDNGKMEDLSATQSNKESLSIVGSSLIGDEINQEVYKTYHPLALAPLKSCSDFSSRDYFEDTDCHYMPDSVISNSTSVISSVSGTKSGALPEKCADELVKIENTSKKDLLENVKHKSVNVADLDTKNKAKTLESITTRKLIPKQKPKSGKFWKEGKQNRSNNKGRRLTFDQRMKSREQKRRNKELSDFLHREREKLEALSAKGKERRKR